MKKQTLIILAAVGGGLAVCCFASLGLLLLAGAEEGAPAGTRAPRDSPLVASWMSGSASMTSYRSLVTGDWAPPSGAGQLYELRADGTCAQYALLQTTTYSCTSSVFTASEDCTWSVDGSAISFELNGGVVRSQMCGGELKESEATTRSLRYQFRLEQDGTNTWLVLTDESGDTRFRRAN